MRTFCTTRARIMWYPTRFVGVLMCIYTVDGFVMSVARGPGEGRSASSRREAINQIAIVASRATVAGALLARPLASTAAQKINRSLGQESFRKIRDARQLLDLVDVPLRARKFDEVQEILEDQASTNLDKALVGLVQSNVLPSDDKVSVGTIRRYGLAADALITLGGLSAAARDGDGGEARKMLVLTKEALNDILTIGVNNNLNKI